MRGLGLLLLLVGLAGAARAETTHQVPPAVAKHTQAGLARQAQAELAASEADARRLYREAIAEYEAAAALAPDHYQAQVLWATCLIQLLPLAGSDTDRARLLHEADRQFAVASQCPGPDHVVFDQWAGLLLDNLDELAPQPEQRVAALRRAVDLAERGLGLTTEPTPRATLQLRLGTALMLLAPAAPDPAAQRVLLERAVEQLRAASRSVTARQVLYENNQLSTALLSLGRLTGDRALLREAAAEMAAGLKFFPQQYDTYYNLAATWSLLGDAEQAAKYLAGAIDHDPKGEYSRLAEQDPDLAAVRGTAAYTAALDRQRRRLAEATARDLFRQALRTQQAAERTKDRAIASRLFEQAATLYQQTLDAVPDHYAAQALSATTLAQLANLSLRGSDQQRRHLDAARARFAAAARNPEADAQLYDQWSTFLLATCYPAESSAAPQRRVLAEACQVLQDGVKRARFTGLRGRLESQLGTTLVMLAQLSGTADASSTGATSAPLPRPESASWGAPLVGAERPPLNPTALYAEALGHFRAAEVAQSVTRTANYYELWGIALLRVGQANKDTMLVRQATERLLKALELRADLPSAHYNLACAYAQLRQPDQALRHLQRSFQQDPQGVFQTSAEKDPDLDPLRRTDAFHQLFRQHPAAGGNERPTVSEK